MLSDEITIDGASTAVLSSEFVCDRACARNGCLSGK